MSDGTSAKLLVLAEGNAACVKITGRANFTSSVDFRTFVNELYQSGFRRFVLDLSECVLMDSTFLGVLAGFALKMNGTSNGDCQGKIELLNPSTRIADILENLGVLALFDVTKGTPVPLDARATLAEPCKPSREEVTRTCLEAHKTLMAINPDNVARFKDVTKFLAEDLKKIKSGA